MGDELPDPRTVHGHTVTPRRADEDDEVLYFDIDEFATSVERIEEFLDEYDTDGSVVSTPYTASITFDIDLVDGEVTDEELADIVEAMKEMEDEHFSEDNGEDYVGYKSRYGSIHRVRNDANVEISVVNGYGAGDRIVFFNKEDLHPDEYAAQNATNFDYYDGEKDYYWYFTKIVDPSEYGDGDFVTEE